MIQTQRTASLFERYRAFGSPLEDVQKEQSSLGVLRPMSPMMGACWFYNHASSPPPVFVSS